MSHRRVRVPTRPARDPGQRPRWRWSLRTRLLVSSIVLIAVVAAVIGTVTTLALQSFLYGKLGADVHTVAGRAAKRGEDPGPAAPGAASGSATDQNTDMFFINGPGIAPGTIGARLDSSGAVTDSGISEVDNNNPSRDRLLVTDLSAEQSAVFANLKPDEKYTLDVPGMGTFCLEAVASNGETLVVGLPTQSVEEIVGTLILVEICVTAAGLLAAGIAGFAVIRISLQPLRRVAATASRVSELRLDRGEVALHERVPAADTDANTEVGQVGAALNRLLGHVGSALEARQESEMRVRQFVADASHELRTPLASIRGYAELTRRGREEIGPDTRHAIGRIESEAGRMTTLVEDLLLLARLDAGRPLSHEEVDLSPLVVDAVSDAWAASPAHDWRLDLPDEPVCVKGDPARLHQVLTNLLANARTHTPHGTTVCARVSQYNGKVALEIMDNGPGIPGDFVPRIFERFARGDASRSRAAGSTGLGLAIVNAVVTAHSGQVGVESRPGLTIFRVLLPAAAQEHSWDSQAVPSYATQS